MNCPNGYLCFHREGLLLILIIIIGLFVYGYTKYQENTYSSVPPTQRNRSSNTRESMMDYPYSDPYSSNILTGTQQNNQFTISNHDIHLQDRIQDRIVDVPKTIIQRPSSYFVTNDTPIQIREPIISIPNEVPVHVQEPIGVPINVPTRGYVSRYEQVGILYGYGPNPQILPLYGKPTYPNSNKWLYYTQSDDYHSVRLPVLHKKRKCSGDYGCEELYDGDEVDVPPYRQKFKVNLYELNTPRYIPYI